MNTFNQRRVIITGASEGIGAELALLLAAQGARLALAARRVDLLEQLARQIRDTHAEAQVLVVRTDVTQDADCNALIEAAVQAFGGIDVLVNNAGVSAHGFFEQVSDFSYYEKVLQVNYLGAMRCTRAALPHLRASRGLIVGVSSYAGKVGVPGRTAYSASKFAMAGFFEALRTELRGSGVDVTMAFPGVILTNTRINGFGPDGGKLGESRLKEEGGLSAQACARIVLRGMARRDREVFTRPIERLGLWIKLLSPALVEKISLRALKRPGS